MIVIQIKPKRSDEVEEQDKQQDKQQEKQQSVEEEETKISDHEGAKGMSCKIFSIFICIFNHCCEH